MTCAHRITRWAHRQNTTTKQWFSEKANGNLPLPIPCYLFTYKYSVTYEYTLSPEHLLPQKELLPR